jgi:hypothetical protein
VPQALVDEVSDVDDCEEDESVEALLVAVEVPLLEEPLLEELP